MPVWFSYITYLVPARYLVDSLRTMLLVGAALGTIAWDVVPLAGMGILLVIMAFRTTKWRPN
jgi:ABC-2 type transport system permease protein